MALDEFRYSIIYLRFRKSTDYGAFGKELSKYTMDKPKSINYKKDGVPYYRSMCISCIRKGKKKKPVRPAWALAGYKKKEKCERCGFKAKTQKQLFVFYVDGVKKNHDTTNLKTICANCSIEIEGRGAGWAPADLVPDL